MPKIEIFFVASAAGTNWADIIISTRPFMEFSHSLIFYRFRHLYRVVLGKCDKKIGAISDRFRLLREDRIKTKNRDFGSVYNTYYLSKD